MLKKKLPILVKDAPKIKRPKTSGLDLFDYYKDLAWQLDPNTTKIIKELFIAGLIVGGGFSIYKGIVIFYCIIRGCLMIAALAQMPEKREHR